MEFIALVGKTRNWYNFWFGNLIQLNDKTLEVRVTLKWILAKKILGMWICCSWEQGSKDGFCCDSDKSSCHNNRNIMNSRAPTHSWRNTVSHGIPDVTTKGQSMKLGTTDLLLGHVRQLSYLYLCIRQWRYGGRWGYGVLTRWLQGVGTGPAERWICQQSRSLAFIFIKTVYLKEFFGHAFFFLIFDVVNRFLDTWQNVISACRKSLEYVIKRASTLVY
jgi:hypothetical protein